MNSVAQDPSYPCNPWLETLRRFSRLNPLRRLQRLKLSPQEQLPLALGLLYLKPPPIMLLE